MVLAEGMLAEGQLGALLDLIEADFAGFSLAVNFAEPPFGEVGEAGNGRLRSAANLKLDLGAMIPRRCKAR